MILYQSPLSTYSLKVRLALAVKGASLDLREPPGGTYRSDEYRALVPPATVPALVDGDFVLTESDAIIEYIDERFAGPVLLPADPQDRARARMVSRLVDLRLEASLRALFPRIKDGHSPSAADLEPAEQALVLVCKMMHAAGPWCCGAAPTLPDFGLAAASVWLDLFRPAGSGPVDSPRFTAWRRACADDRRFEPLLAPYRDTASGWLAGLGFRGSG